MRILQIRPTPAIALATLRKLKTSLGGCFGGGMQGEPRRGRSPITGPALPRAAQASQTSPGGETKSLSINNLEKMLSFWYAFLQWRQAYEREIMGSV